LRLMEANKKGGLGEKVQRSSTDYTRKKRRGWGWDRVNGRKGKVLERARDNRINVDLESGGGLLSEGGSVKVSYTGLVGDTRIWGV